MQRLNVGKEKKGEMFIEGGSLRSEEEKCGVGLWTGEGTNETHMIAQTYCN
jgi:hypothetical protein